MKRFIPVLIIIILFPSCRKSESDSNWGKSYGKGEAYFINTSSDSGIVACGELGGYPYFLRLDKSKKIILEFSADNAGLFNSVWFDASGYITGGNAGGNMLLMRQSAEGNKLWEKSLNAGFKIDFTTLSYEGNGNLLAVGTASPDSAGSETAGLLFVRFDTTGQVINQKQIDGAPFVAASKIALDYQGNIYIALTRNGSGTKPKASVAKFNNLFQKLWETELYTNPDYGSASLAIKLDGSGNIYVAGKTELYVEGGIQNNSFLVSLTNSGSVRWKNYLESSNAGSALIFDEGENLLMLNRNCYIINIADPESGTDAGILRLFDVCNSGNTDAFGADMVINYDKNIMVAGSYGGNFYVAQKSLQQ